MAKRFTETVQLQPQNMDTGAARGMMNLANRLDNFASTIKSASVQAGARVGAREGAAQELGTTQVDGREITAAPVRREASLLDIIATGGERTSAYNRTVGKAYIASISNDNRESMAAIELEHKDDMMAYNNAADGYIKGVMEGVDPILRGAVREDLDSHLTTGRIRVNQRAEQKSIDKANASLNDTANSSGDAAARAARNGMPFEGALATSFAALDALVDSGGMTPATASKMKTSQRLEVKEQVLRRGFDQIFTNGQPIGEQFKEAYQQLENISGKTPKGWTPDEWDAFIRSENADLNARAGRAKNLQAEQSMETALQVSNLKIKSKTGIGEPSDIIKEANDLFASGDITGNERASIISATVNSYKKGMEKLEENTQHLNNVALRLSGESSQVLSQKDIDYAWDNVYSQQMGDDPLTRDSNTVQFIDDTKMIPTAVRDQLRNDVNSEDPDLVTEAADMMDRLDLIRGIPENNFTANERAMSKAMAGLIKNMDGKEALTLARRATDPNDRARIDLRTQQIKDMKKKIYGFGGMDYVEVIKEEYQPTFGPEVREFDEAKLAAEYGVLFEQHYIAGMEVDDAKAKSLEILERNWGGFNDQFMKYPPSDFYAVAGDSDYIVDELHQSVMDFGFAGVTVEKKNIFLISNQETARTASKGAPTYGVSVFIEGEGLIPLIGFKFFPDTQAEVERLEAESEAAIKEARTRPAKAGAAILKEGRFSAIN